MSNKIIIDKFGFREYDARWLYKKDINKAGIRNLGKGFGSQIIQHTNPRNISYIRTNNNWITNFIVCT